MLEEWYICPPSYVYLHVCLSICCLFPSLYTRICLLVTRERCLLYCRRRVTARDPIRYDQTVPPIITTIEKKKKKVIPSFRISEATQLLHYFLTHN